MTSSPQLPIWISYSQALAVPIIAVVIAAFGAWIAARQMVIADEKLKLDAFDRQYDRRVAVYEATRKVLEDVYQNNMSAEQIQVYGLCALDAKFLFDEDLYKYLTEIRHRVAAWNSAKPRPFDLGPDDRSDNRKRIESENLNWINQQGDEQTGFDVRFRPFLMHKQVKRSWWLRWP
jgi:hypothetical protein